MAVIILFVIWFSYNIIKEFIENSKTPEPPIHEHLQMSLDEMDYGKKYVKKAMYEGKYSRPEDFERWKQRYNIK